VFSENGYTAVRILSAGSPVRRVQLANIFGTYRYNVVSFTNHRVHPGSPSTFEDISLRGIFCSKSGQGMKVDPAKPGSPYFALVWIDAPAVVSSLTIADYHRTESVWPAANILIEAGATAESLHLSNVSVINRTLGAINVLRNKGTVGWLGMTNVYAKADEGSSRGAVVSSPGLIRRYSLENVSAVNVDFGLTK
jgi:hypothetical protein